MPSLIDAIQKLTDCKFRAYQEDVKEILFVLYDLEISGATDNEAIKPLQMRCYSLMSIFLHYKNQRLDINIYRHFQACYEALYLTSRALNEIVRIQSEPEYCRELGSGGFSTTYLGFFEGMPVAIKKMKNNSNKERQIHARLSHPNIVKYLGSIPNSNNLVMELMVAGNLSHILRHNKADLTWANRLSIALDISHALCYMHSQHVLHCDLKTSNVLLDENMRAKISDFGLSAACSNIDTGISGVRSGTPGWMAPEVLNSGKYSNKSDIYSLGLIFFDIVKQVFHASRCVEFNKLDMAATESTHRNQRARPTADKIVTYLESEKSYRVW